MSGCSVRFGHVTLILTNSSNHPTQKVTSEKLRELHKSKYEIGHAFCGSSGLVQTHFIAIIWNASTSDFFLESKLSRIGKVLFRVGEEGECL